MDERKQMTNKTRVHVFFLCSHTTIKTEDFCDLERWDFSPTRKQAVLKQLPA
jgi:hypothetical protein